MEPGRSGRVISLTDARLVDLPVAAIEPTHSGQSDASAVVVIVSHRSPRSPTSRPG